MTIPFTGLLKLTLYHRFRDVPKFWFRFDLPPTPLFLKVFNFYNPHSFSFGITNVVAYNRFLWKVLRQSNTDVKSFFMQFKKIGRGLLQEAFSELPTSLVSKLHAKWCHVGATLPDQFPQKNNCLLQMSHSFLCPICASLYGRK